MHYDTVILGAGAAGLFCAKFASENGARIAIIDHAKAAGEKIRISGGGRCNFTNIYTSAENFICQNPHFVKSALSRYSPYDFMDMMQAHGLSYHEKTLGQYFCDQKSGAIISMLLEEAKLADVMLKTSILSVTQENSGAYKITISQNNATERNITATNLVIATGGKSIPKMGATGIGYDIAEQFGHSIIETRPALVPLTFAPHELEWIKPLAGTAVDGSVTNAQTCFKEALLFTHRGLSGPAILQISSYWLEGQEIRVNLSPDISLFDQLRDLRDRAGRKQIGTHLATLLPNKLATHICERFNLSGNLADFSDKKLQKICADLHDLRLKPSGSEGYRTAEVTLGGVNTDELSSKTMESKTHKGLYFIGEVVDVTGWLGGYNFQWAWASAAACGRAIASSHSKAA